MASRLGARHGSFMLRLCWVEVAEAIITLQGTDTVRCGDHLSMIFFSLCVFRMCESASQCVLLSQCRGEQDALSHVGQLAYVYVAWQLWEMPFFSSGSNDDKGGKWGDTVRGSLAASMHATSIECTVTRTHSSRSTW